jgi:hypothetical protein
MLAKEYLNRQYPAHLYITISLHWLLGLQLMGAAAELVRKLGLVLVTLARQDLQVDHHDVG